MFCFCTHCSAFCIKTVDSVKVLLIFFGIQCSCESNLKEGKLKVAMRFRIMGTWNTPNFP